MECAHVQQSEAIAVMSRNWKYNIHYLALTLTGGVELERPPARKCWATLGLNTTLYRRSETDLVTGV